MLCSMQIDGLIITFKEFDFMKKTIFAAALILALSMILTSCSSTKEVTSAADFVSEAERQGYVTQDLTYTFDSELLENLTVALQEDGAFQVELYTLIDEATALQLYTENKAAIEAAQGSSKTSTEKSGANYAKYSQKSGGMYSVVCCVGNTMLYASADMEHEKAIKSLFDSVGY